jgi:CDP-glycerol glycerophosphotransferase (TagB/SpsB family)
MREKGYTGLFCLHPIFSKQSVDFEGNDVFEINRGPVDYKNIFSTSSLLVTDYSSIFFDFTYLRKPVIHAQFDRDTFYEGQNYEQGYFDWDKDAFGPICKDLDSTIDEIIACLDRDCQAEPKYIERMDNFFAFDDKNNCERIYEAIKNM